MTMGEGCPISLLRCVTPPSALGQVCVYLCEGVRACVEDMAEYSRSSSHSCSPCPFSACPATSTTLNDGAGQLWEQPLSILLNSCPNAKLIPPSRILLENFGKWGTMLLWDVFISASGVRARQTGWRLEGAEGPLSPRDTDWRVRVSKHWGGASACLNPGRWVWQSHLPFTTANHSSREGLLLS